MPNQDTPPPAGRTLPGATSPAGRAARQRGLSAAPPAASEAAAIVMSLASAAPGAAARGAVSAGMYSSGATWVFNVVQHLVRLGRPEARIAPVYVDELRDEEEAALRGADFAVIRTHVPGAGLRALAALAGLPVLLTVREPRDAAASLMQRFRVGFPEALQAVSASARALLRLRAPDVMELRYEDRFTASSATIGAIAARLGLAATEAQCREIADALSPDAVAAEIERLFGAGRLDRDRPAHLQWDARTHWHPRHVGDGRIGKWRDVLNPTQAGQVLHATQAYCQAFGYGGTDPVVSGTELRFATGGLGLAHLGAGFAPPEEWGVWTVGEEASLTVPLDRPVGSRLTLEIGCALAPALRTDGSGAEMRLLVNGQLRLTLRPGAETAERARLVLHLEGPVMAGWTMLELRFAFAGLRSPAELGQGREARRIGVGLRSLRVDFG